MRPQDRPGAGDVGMSAVVRNGRSQMSNTARSIRSGIGRLVSTIVSLVNRPLEPQTLPALRLTTFFRLVGASKRPLRCASYRVANGIELRIEYEDRDDVLKTHLFKPSQQQMISETAASWRAAFDGRGFTELPDRE